MIKKVLPKSLQGMPKTVLGLVVLALLYVAQQMGYLNSSERLVDTLSSSESAVSQHHQAGERIRCKVLKVYDGDTLACDLNGNGRVDKPQEKIRLLGIDTPETRFSAKLKRKQKTSTPKDEPYAQEAREFLLQKVADQTVYLQFDRERTDRYGRTLAFVYGNESDDKSMNQKLIEQGFAAILFIDPNRQFKSQFKQAEKEARHARQGIWKPVSRS